MCGQLSHVSRQEGLAGIFGVPERYIDSITFKHLSRVSELAVGLASLS